MNVRSKLGKILSIKMLKQLDNNASTYKKRNEPPSSQKEAARFELHNTAGRHVYLHSISD